MILHTSDNGPFSKLLGEKHVLELKTACKVLSMKSGMEKCKLCYLEFPSRKDVAQHIATAHKVEVTPRRASNVAKRLFARDRANLTGLVLGCIEAKICKKMPVCF